MMLLAPCASQPFQMYAPGPFRAQQLIDGIQMVNHLQSHGEGAVGAVYLRIAVTSPHRLCSEMGKGQPPCVQARRLWQALSYLQRGALSFGASHSQTNSMILAQWPRSVSLYRKGLMDWFSFNALMPSPELFPLSFPLSALLGATG